MEQCPGLGIAREEVGQPDSGMIVRNLECGEERRYAGGVHVKNTCDGCRRRRAAGQQRRRGATVVGCGGRTLGQEGMEGVTVRDIEFLR